MQVHNAVKHDLYILNINTRLGENLRIFNVRIDITEGSILLPVKEHKVDLED